MLGKTPFMFRVVGSLADNPEIAAVSADVFLLPVGETCLAVGLNHGAPIEGLAVFERELLLAGYEVAASPRGLMVSPALKETFEMAAAGFRRKKRVKTEEDDEGDDAPGDLPQLRVIHDGKGFRIIHNLFSHYVGADDDFRNVMMFMRDVDELLSKYRKAMGLDPERPVEAGNHDAKDEKNAGRRTRLEQDQDVRRAQKRQEDEAPGGDAVA